MLSFFSSEGPRFQLITAFEIKLLATAAFLIWFAKWQDKVLAGTPEPAARTVYRQDVLAGIPGRLPGNYSIENQRDTLKDATLNGQFQDESMGIARPKSAAEERFLKCFYQQEKLHRAHASREQWAALMKNATVTFLAVEEIFQTASGRPGETFRAEEILASPQRAEQIFSALEKRFGISQSVLRRFAETGERSLAEWAFFVEQRQG